MSYDGIIPSILSGSVVNYNPWGFMTDGLSGLVKSLQKESKPREVVLLGSADGLGYIGAVIANDDEKIAFYERKWRIEKISRFRELFRKYGTEAKVIAWLNEKNRCLHGETWRLNQWDLIYKGFGKGEMESVSLYVDRRKDGLYDIRLIAQEDWSDPKYKLILRSGITHKSVFNHINYFVKKLKGGVY